MTSPSILYFRAEEADACDQTQPEIFTDLGLDQIVSAIIHDKAEYKLAEFFYTPLTRPDDVQYRQAALQDIERPGMLLKLKAFAQRMHVVRAQSAQVEKRYHPIQQMFWFLDTVSEYCETIHRLRDDLAISQLNSEAFQRMHRYVSGYADSTEFTKMAEDTEKLKAKLSAIRCDILVRGLYVTVSDHERQPDYGKEVQCTFANFQGKSTKPYNFARNQSPDVTGVVGRALEKMAILHEATFDELGAFCRGNAAFIDPAIAAFDRELQFYIAFLGYIAPLRKAGLRFCYPAISETDKTISATDSFDLALATKLNATHLTPVCNDVSLSNDERVIVVSGPNQGGKTTFSRTFGQLHYFASLGCLVAASAAQLFLPDQIFTHFERAERMISLRGKLQDDLIRIRDILDSATPRSIIIINEIFASTTLEDATFLSHEIGEIIMDLDLLCVWVTFIEEMASFSPKSISMVSTVLPDNPDHRTFKIIRQPANGLAYAMSIARKYRLTREAIRERIEQ